MLSGKCGIGYWLSGRDLDVFKDTRAPRVFKKLGRFNVNLNSNLFLFRTALRKRDVLSITPLSTSNWRFWSILKEAWLAYNHIFEWNFNIFFIVLLFQGNLFRSFHARITQQGVFSIKYFGVISGLLDFWLWWHPLLHLVFFICANLFNVIIFRRALNFLLHNYPRRIFCCFL